MENRQEGRRTDKGRAGPSIIHMVRKMSWSKIAPSTKILNLMDALLKQPDNKFLVYSQWYVFQLPLHCTFIFVYTFSRSGVVAIVTASDKIRRRPVVARKTSSCDRNQQFHPQNQLFLLLNWQFLFCNCGVWKNSTYIGIP